MGIFDDLLQQDFVIDPDEDRRETDEEWDTGIEDNVFTTGEKPDIFSTK